MLRLRITALLYSLLLVSCAPKEAPGPTMAPPEATETPTITSAPHTATATSTIQSSTVTQFVETAEMPIPEVLQLEPGDYLVYLEEIESGDELIFIKSDGSSMVSRRFSYFPPYAMHPLDGVSPDGKYFAFYTGYAGMFMEYDPAQKFNLQLNIISLRGGTDVIEIPLLSIYYPLNFVMLAEENMNQLSEEIRATTPEDAAPILYDAFLQGIGSLEWSPDSRYLAFAGQMDGFSSDLYLFDTEDDSVTRLTSGPGQIQRISWSPDSKHIMHASANMFSVHTPTTNHVVSVDGTNAISFPYDVGEFEGGWLNNDQYFVHEAANGPGEYDITLLDITEGTAQMIWPDSFSTTDYIARRNLLLVTTLPTESELEPGVFLVNINNASYSRIATGIASGKALEHNDYLCAVSLVDDGTYLVTMDHETQKISEMSGRIAVSPSDDLLAIYGSNYRDEKNGLDIYSLQDQSTITVFDRSVSKVIWSPEASCLFFVADDSLYRYDVTQRTTTLIDPLIERSHSWRTEYRFIHIE
ncbi:MAG: hypothetical protein P8Z34_14265 [Anaerolineales bacterium]